MIPSLDSLTSFTGGGDLAASSGVGGDDGGKWGAFNYKGGSQSNNNQMLMLGLMALVAVAIFKGK